MAIVYLYPSQAAYLGYKPHHGCPKDEKRGYKVDEKLWWCITTIFIKPGDTFSVGLDKAIKQGFIIDSEKDKGKGNEQGKDSNA